MPNLASLIIAAGLFLPPFHVLGGDPHLGLICAEEIIRGDSLVKVDQERKRMFVVMKNTQQAELEALIQKLECCFKDHEWNNQWSLSVFSSKRIAGYKDEPNIIPFHKKNEWAKGYLAEYDARTRALTLTPATSPKETILQITP